MMSRNIYPEVSAKMQERKAQAQKETFFAGEGTAREPYLINTVEDLAYLSKSVNEGNVYKGVYFLQTADLDMADYGIWTPIGKYGGNFAFSGIYDSDGHRILNITIGDPAAPENVGLFGILDGTVCNLGIESGTISGSCVGSIASHSASDKAVIANCYNRASVYGTGRAGGIADNFSGGRIICCANSGQVDSGTVGSITSYTAREVYGCHGTGELINGNFRGTLKNQYIEDVIDFSTLNSDLAKAKDLYDLKNIELKPW